jgi:hypothetical protein
MEGNGLDSFGAGDAQMFNLGAWEDCEFLPPVIGRQIEVRRPDKVADPAAFMRFFDS